MGIGKQKPTPAPTPTARWQYDMRGTVMGKNMGSAMSVAHKMGSTELQLYGSGFFNAEQLDEIIALLTDIKYAMQCASQE